MRTRLRAGISVLVIDDVEIAHPLKVALVVHLRAAMIS